MITIMLYEGARQARERAILPSARLRFILSPRAPRGKKNKEYRRREGGRDRGEKDLKREHCRTRKTINLEWIQMGAALTSLPERSLMREGIKESRHGGRVSVHDQHKPREDAIEAKATV